MMQMLTPSPTLFQSVRQALQRRRKVEAERLAFTNLMRRKDSHLLEDVGLTRSSAERMIQYGFNGHRTNR
ncbi:hypothetical protein [Rhizobium halophytocola]|uniref:Uncharacterized protein YjiS (DUF1127 family) n=1 Tax=Rhizobium halophytocola TaxID=735519 RepID=A0ABS4E3P7_9HYPH|nr:hypothetical protein [Rhizobium halophytocola]MBP1852542.1 uncharacterized protein YjiS (DUF1127 family) [Rhizobium halophytocola]